MNFKKSDHDDYCWIQDMEQGQTTRYSCNCSRREQWHKEWDEKHKTTES